PDFLDGGLQQIDGSQRCVGRQQFLELDRLLVAQIVAVAQQQPARALDDLTLCGRTAQGIGLIDAHPVDDLPTKAGDDMEQVIDYFGILVTVAAHDLAPVLPNPSYSQRNAVPLMGDWRAWAA